MTWSWGGCVLGVKGVDDVLAGVELGVVFLGVKGVDDVLAGRGAGFGRFVGVKGVDDVLAGVEPYGGVYGDSAVDGVFGPFSRSSGRPGVSASFSSPRALTPVSARGLLPISS